MARPASPSDLYFTEVGREALPTKDKNLRAEEERALFTAYGKARTRMELATNAHDREVARKEMVGIGHTISKRYLRFVIKEARKRTRDDEVFKDLISEGNCGLMRGIEKFDLEVGVNYLTYGANWIKVFMQEYLNKLDPVHVPSHTRKEMRRRRNQEDRERSANGYAEQSDIIEPTITSIDKVSIADPDEDIERKASERRCNLLSYFAAARLNELESTVLIYLFGLHDGGAAKTPAEVSQILYEIDASQILPPVVEQVRDVALTRLRVALKSDGVDSTADLLF